MKHGVIAVDRLTTVCAERYRERGHWPGIPLGVSFERTCERQPERPALWDDSVEITFEELAERTRALAAGLASLGVSAGDAVAYQLPNWWEAAVTLLATVSLGAH